jgi:hypothetical protein
MQAAKHIHTYMIIYISYFNTMCFSLVKIRVTRDVFTLYYLHVMLRM